MILLVFALALVLGVISFFVLSPRRAVLVCLIGGWVLLPTANIVAPNSEVIDADRFSYALSTGIGSALYGPCWLTRSSLIGLTVLIGMLLTDWKTLIRFRPKWFDVPVLIWCVMPLFSALSNQLGFEFGLRNVSYYLLAWAVPYLAGRIYFADLKPLRELGIALVIAGLCYIPFCIIEGITGPIFYELIYGFHPYRFDGAQRVVGYRPIVFLEHGSQLGIWMSSIALLAFWMHMSGALPKFKWIPAHVAVFVLIVTAFLCQSLGSCILMLLGIVTWTLIKKNVKIPRFVLVMFAVMLIGMMAFVMGGDQVVGKVLGQQTVLKLKNYSRLKSMGWRVNVIRRGMGSVKEQPVLGLGRWDWWELQEENKRPVWSLFLQGMGVNGIFAGLALLGIFAIPIWQFINGCPVRLWTDMNLGPAAVLMIFLFMHAVDSMLNPTFSTSLICVAGGLNSIGPLLKRALKSA